jgi:hypothetical protein
MLAVFSEDVGPALVEHLESLGITSMWVERKRWVGSRSAKAAGLL